ncbi:MAG: DDE-type integrase/transposase/recombinase [Planctomycetes bacterium]|nr:DDE-type integrase/transposase/recombinase [Planctomycetota bacterium]
MARRHPLALPRGWTRTVRSSFLHAASVAFTALTFAWRSAARSRRVTIRVQAELDRAETEIALLREELDIKDERLGRIPPRRRSHYGPIQRMRILELKAARGWSSAQTARVFGVTEDTIVSWLRRIDEATDRPLVRLPGPANRFPDFVAHLVQRLKVLCPSLGKLRIAQVLARAGLHLGTTTVGRMLRSPSAADDVEQALLIDEQSAEPRRVTAKYPDHVWHVDLTVVPTAAGFWVPWLPFSRPQRWPFCWWVAVVVDHLSRRVCGFAVFTKMPTSTDICRFLDRETSRRGNRKPRHIVADKGKQFFCATFRNWCARRRIRPRFGAVGRQGSIAVVERFIRSMKSECTRRIRVPFDLRSMRDEIGAYATWYNEHRPHQALDGRTPSEAHGATASPARTVAFEPRPRWPVSNDDDVTRVRDLRLHVTHFDGRRHLPIVELSPAA